MRRHGRRRLNRQLGGTEFLPLEFGSHCVRCLGPCTSGTGKLDSVGHDFRIVLACSATLGSTVVTCGVCVGCAIVKGDHAPDCGVAQGVIHGVTVRHGEKQEEEEGEAEQEVESQEEENAQTTMRMSMDGME